MKRAFLSLIFLSISLPLSAAMVDSVQIVALYDQERSGIKAYQAGNYESAFKKLSGTATKGLKDSQYLVALMLLKGQGVSKSTLGGFGWLGVAIESGNEEWIETYNSMYESLNQDQRAMIDEQVRRYVEKYGSAAQGMSCTKRPLTGSHRAELRCSKVEGIYPDHEFEPAL
jgi:TPR repeat protein